MAVVQFDKYTSIADYLRSLESAPMLEPWANQWGGPASNRKKDKWSGGVSFDEAADLARAGWSVESAKMAAEAERIASDMIRANAPSPPRADYRGSVPIVARAIAGHPRSMRRMPRTARKAEPVRLAYTIAAPAKAKPGELIKGGALVWAVSSALERAGIPTEVWITDGTSEVAFNETRAFAVRVKMAGDTGAAGQLAFFAAHPASLRRLSFRWTEQNFPRYIEGYGHPAQIKDRASYTEAVKAAGLLHLGDYADMAEYLRDDPANLLKWIIKETQPCH